MICSLLQVPFVVRLNATPLEQHVKCIGSARAGWASSAENHETPYIHTPCISIYTYICIIIICNNIYLHIHYYTIYTYVIAYNYSTKVCHPTTCPICNINSRILAWSLGSFCNLRCEWGGTDRLRASTCWTVGVQGSSFAGVDVVWSTNGNKRGPKEHTFWYAHLATNSLI